MSAGYTYREIILRDLIARKHSLAKDIVDLIITYLPDYKRIWAKKNLAIVLKNIIRHGSVDSTSRCEILDAHHPSYTMTQDLPIDTQSVLKNTRLKNVVWWGVNYDLTRLIERFAVNTGRFLTENIYFMPGLKLFFFRTITQH
jgi:hypothetical protein